MTCNGVKRAAQQRAARVYQAGQLSDGVQSVSGFAGQLDEGRFEGRGHGRQCGQGWVDHPHVGGGYRFCVAVIHVQDLKLAVAKALQHFAAVEAAVSVEQAGANVAVAGSYGL